MALLEYVSPDTADDRLQELFDADADTYGRPSLFARMLAHDPDVLAARQAYVGALRDSSSLSEREAELVYATVAGENDCAYCAASHTEQLVEHVELPRGTADAALAGDDGAFDGREQALVAFARRTAADPKRVDETDLASLRAHDFDDGDIVSLVTLIAAAVSANVIADALTIRPQDEPELDHVE